jgi:hypothetical protein
MKIMDISIEPDCTNSSKVVLNGNEYTLMRLDIEDITAEDEALMNELVSALQQ